MCRSMNRLSILSKQDIHPWNTSIRSKRDQQRSYKPTTWWYCSGCQFAPNLCHWGHVNGRLYRSTTSCLRVEEYEIHPIHAATPRSFPWLPNRSDDIRYRDFRNDRWTSMTVATLRVIDDWMSWKRHCTFPVVHTPASLTTTFSLMKETYSVKYLWSPKKLPLQWTPDWLKETRWVRHDDVL